MKNLKAYTVSIGIPAYNEERNIALILSDVLKQKETNFKIKEVIVVCDASSDNTYVNASRVAKKDKRVKVIYVNKRGGQAARLNQLLKLATGDIFITFDADVRLKNRTVVKSLVNAIAKGADVVAGKDQAAGNTNLIQKVIVTGNDMWFETRKGINNGDTVHNLQGCIWGARKKFYKHLDINVKSAAVDEYIYLYAKEKGFSFSFVEDAVVYFKVPTNFSEYLMQSGRFITNKNAISKEYDEKLDHYYTVPFINKIRGILVTFFAHPLLTLATIWFQVALRLVVIFRKNESTGIWKAASTTKLL